MTNKQLMDFLSDWRFVLKQDPDGWNNTDQQAYEEILSMTAKPE